MPATVYAVAEKAGVSIATVSRVLNTPDKVHETTRQRVLAAINELGFVPKAEAVARARSATGRIGVLAPFFTHPSFVERLRGVADALIDSGYELIVYMVDSAARRDAYYVNLPISRRLDGLIVMALAMDDVTAERMQKNKLAVVQIEAMHPIAGSIEIDDAAGGRLAAQHFLAHGHRRCAFLGEKDLPDYSMRPAERRLAGYSAALAEAGAPLLGARIIMATQSIEEASQAMHYLLGSVEPPTAVFAATDTMAMGVLKAARERGVRVPQDLAVIGFDDLEIASYLGLTTIRQHLRESGRLAVELLLARLADPTRPVPHIKLPLELIQRGTA